MTKGVPDGQPRDMQTSMAEHRRGERMQTRIVRPRSVGLQRMGGTGASAMMGQEKGVCLLSLFS